jgi:uncharacterized protein (TIGR00369 family)
MELKPKSGHCYVCGPENAAGLQVSFSPEGANGSKAVYTARSEHGGWPGILHGGVTFSLMDEALGWALYFHGMAGVTARVETRFRQPIPIGTSLSIRAWTIERRRQLVTARAEIRDEGETLLAEADATMFLLEN